MKHTLSPRQVQIMRLLCRGLTDKEMAGETGLSCFTIGGYVKTIRLRLHARNRLHAVAIWASRRIP